MPAPLPIGGIHKEELHYALGLERVEWHEIVDNRLVDGDQLPLGDKLAEQGVRVETLLFVVPELAGSPGLIGTTCLRATGAEAMDTHTSEAVNETRGVV